MAMSLETPVKIRMLQRKLYQKAKGEQRMQRNHEAGRFSIQLWARVLAAPAIRVDPEVPHAHDAGERLEREP